MGRAQQMLMEFWAEQLKDGPAVSRRLVATGVRLRRAVRAATDPMALMSAGRAGLGQGAGDVGQDARRGDRRAGCGREGAQGPPLRCARMARKSDLRHDPPDLSADFRPAARHGRRDRGRRPATAREAAVRDAQLRRCDEPVELRADQSAGAEADASRRAARICSRASPTCSRTLRRGS